MWLDMTSGLRRGELAGLRREESAFAERIRRHLTFARQSHKGFGMNAEKGGCPFCIDVGL